jgi:hypothetical protein
MSMWLGPPDSQNRMTDFGLPADADAVAASALARNNCGADSPATPASPALKNHRRVPDPIPSRSRVGGPQAETPIR